MKWILLLALTTVISCSHKKEAASGDVAASTATESEAQPVSPHTVKPCFCQKIYQPVCAAGVNYGNSCEAECNGNKTWTDGNCAEAAKKTIKKK